jgi:hypothetical protein
MEVIASATEHNVRHDDQVTPSTGIFISPMREALNMALFPKRALISSTVLSSYGAFPSALIFKKRNLPGFPASTR